VQKWNISVPRARGQPSRGKQGRTGRRLPILLWARADSGRKTRQCGALDPNVRKELPDDAALREAMADENIDWGSIWSEILLHSRTRSFGEPYLFPVLAFTAPHEG
jgi:hypothetical protein